MMLALLKTLAEIYGLVVAFSEANEAAVATVVAEATEAAVDAHLEERYAQSPAFK